MTVQQELTANYDRIITTMLKMSEGGPASENDRRQFCVGFLHLVAEAAGGNMSPRDIYLTSVIPSIKRAAMPLGAVIAGMVQVSIALCVEASDENRTWIVNFCSDYANRLAETWTQN